jgi:hypothetical protein
MTDVELQGKWIFYLTILDPRDSNGPIVAQGLSGKSMYLTENGSDRRQLSRRPASTGVSGMAFCRFSALREDPARLVRQEGSAAWSLGPDIPQAASISAPGEAIEVRNANSSTFEKEGHMRQASYKLFLLAVFFVLSCAGVYAQANSELTGIVTDQTGAVVAGAKIVLTDPATGASKTVTSGATGLYDITGLNPANFNMKITAKGFETYAQTGVVINVSTTSRVDVKLTVGAET